MTTEGAHQYLRTHTLSAEHLVLDLATAETELRAGAESEQNRRGVTLVRESGMSVVIEYLRSGASLDEHSTPGAVTVQVLSGHVEVLVGKEQLDARSGMLVAFDANVPHSVHAIDDSTLLLTLSAPPPAEATSR